MKHSRFMIRPLALILLATMLSGTFARSAGMAGNDPKASNIQFRFAEGKVILTYDLHGEPGKKYRVAVLLKKESDPSRSYRPKLLSGDCGEGITPGQERRIVWDLVKEIPAGLPGDDYYFLISVEEESSGFPWWAGAVVVGAGLVSLLVFSSDPGETQEPELPPPPGRP